VDDQVHPDPTFVAGESNKSGSFVLVALIALFVTGKSPVLKDPAPAYVLEELFGDRNTESPIWTIELGPTARILKDPTMEGIGLTSFCRLDSLGGRCGLRSRL
jgi:hypothetical protein